MKPCSCVVHVGIANEKGEEAVYSCRPVPPAELAEAAAGFLLVKHSDPSPVYAVTVGADGAVRCNCPQHSRAELVSTPVPWWPPPSCRPACSPSSASGARCLMKRRLS